MSERLRVLFAIGEMSGGGSQRQLVGVLQRLDRNQFQPFLYLVSPGGELLPEVPADVQVVVFRDRWRQPWWSYPGQAHRACVRDLAAVLREQKIDVVYDRTYHMTLIAGPAARQAGVKRVSVIVTDPERDFAGNVERFRWIKGRLLRRAYQTADRVVAVSEGIRQAAIEYYGLQPDKVLTIYNLFDIERIDRLMAEPLPADQVASQAGRFEIVAAGRLHPQKGFLYLLEAIRELVQQRGREQVHLRILGTGPQEAELRGFIAQHQLQLHVTLVGFRQNPLPYFRQANLFCLSSLYEGMPNALVEAMLCRVPVLSTDCPSGPREILQAGQLSRLVSPANSRALADAIEDALLRPDEWQSRVPAARAHIDQTFSPDAGIQRVEELLRGVAE